MDGQTTSVLEQTLKDCDKAICIQTVGVRAGVGVYMWVCMYIGVYEHVITTCVERGDRWRLSALELHWKGDKSERAEGFVEWC